MSKPTIERTLDQYRNGHFVRVVNYHSTPRVQRAELEAELAGFARDYAPVTVDDLDRLFETGTWAKDKPGIIPVFYEGYRNSAEVAGPLCDTYGLTGWFPVATSFIACDPEHQEAFARSHWISLVEEDMQGGRIAMSWDEVADLSERHVVIPHTAHHEGFDTVLDEADLQREVFDAKRALDDVTGQDSPAFAWLHGSSWGQSAMHDDAVVRAGFRYQFSNTMIHRVA
jgi:hypothetical protein